MKRWKSEYDRIGEVAKRLLSPSWVRRYCKGDDSVAEKVLAEKHGFDGRESYMRYLCHLFYDYVDEKGFSAAVEAYKEQGRLDLLAKFADFEIDVSPELKVGTMPDRAYIGECYSQALNYLGEHLHDKAVLVLGHVTERLQDTIINHAWVEIPGGIVFDGVTQRFYRQQDYYERRGAVKKKECDYMEALVKAGRGSVSPWDD